MSAESSSQLHHTFTLAVKTYDKRSMKVQAPQKTLKSKLQQGAGNFHYSCTTHK
jgi:hypothetical protein